MSVLIAEALSIHSMPLYAIGDGSYIATVYSSYANPETGEISDGGSNQALGESMVKSIMEPNALVEMVGGRVYVTVGLGLMSNVSNVRIQVGTQPVGLTHTGTTTKNDDNCNHYRFEVASLNAVMSAILYVVPMGRDVQFYFTIDASSLTPGTGIYQSLLVSQVEARANDEASTPSVEASDQEATEASTKELKEIKTRSYKELYEEAKGLSINNIDNVKQESNSYWGFIIAGIIIVGGGIAFLAQKKYRGVK